MMMTNSGGLAETAESLGAVWQKVESNLNHGAKRVAVASKAAQYFGKSEFGSFAFYLILDEKPLHFTEIEVIEQTVELRQDGRYNFRLELAQPEFRSEFFRITSEMAFEGQFGGDEKACFENVRQVYENWVTFFRRARKMTDEIARGIYAELKFVEMIIELGCSAMMAVNSWVGPFDAPQDFLFPNGSAAEIKAIRPAANQIRISSEFQLDFVGDLTLAVYSLESLEQEASDGESLRELAEKLKALLSAAEAIEIFEDRLSAIGLKIDSKDGNRRFKVHMMDAYAAGASEFPSLKASSMDNRIRRVEYSIARNAIDDFRIDLVDQWT